MPCIGDEREAAPLARAEGMAARYRTAMRIAKSVIIAGYRSDADGRRRRDHDHAVEVPASGNGSRGIWPGGGTRTSGPAVGGKTLHAKIGELTLENDFLESAWRLSITMEAAFCVETLEDALARHGRPDIFNTDQGSQFTGTAFRGVLASHGIAISMDGRDAWRDNVFVERLWRSVKYEEVYLRAYDTLSDARASIGQYLAFYNGRRPHSSLDGSTPDQAYFNQPPFRMAA